MFLLVSVASPADAAAALVGGADLIDAKDPLAGALGAVTLEALRAIHATVAGARPVTAALGDAAAEEDVERAAREFAAAGALFVKVGFAGIDSSARATALVAAAVRGAGGSGGGAGVVAVAYADAAGAGSLPPASLLDVAVRADARGLLLDTADKSGPGLCALQSPLALARLVTDAHSAGLFVAMAGKLEASDLPLVGDTGADIVGVRGAACVGGRTGVISAERVRQLRGVMSVVHSPDLPAAANSSFLADVRVRSTGPLSPRR